MEAGHPSRTALLVAGYRARATARPAPVCDDPWAQAISGREGEVITRDYDELFPHMELWVAVRTAFIDERVRRATMALGVRQVVVLGAGFDTRAARLATPGVRFFEVDRSETQSDKIARLRAAAGYPFEAATYVACDFELQDFVTELAHAGFSLEQPALVIWEGVTPYLTEPAIRATLRRIASGLAPDSVVVFDHLRRKIVAGAVKDEKDLASREFVADLGEPLRFGVDDVLPLLYEEGFRRVRTSNFDEACLALTGTYERDRKFRFQGLAVASRAAAELP
jgi:methyltransferase (TIGR00027 family)